MATDFYCDQVLTGIVAVDRLVETDHVLAYHHTQPYWPVHIVIIPKRHIPSLAALAPDDLPIVQEMLSIAADLCRRLTAEHGGCRLSTNCGDHQSTAHFHFYLHSGPASAPKTAPPSPSDLPCPMIHALSRRTIELSPSVGLLPSQIHAPSPHSIFQFSFFNFHFAMLLPDL